MPARVDIASKTRQASLSITRLPDVSAGEYAAILQANEAIPIFQNDSGGWQGRPS